MIDTGELNKIISNMEIEYKISNFTFVVNRYELIEDMIAKDFFLQKKDYINFHDMILISYKELNDYKRVLRLVKTQINELVKLKRELGDEFRDRMLFYCMILSDVYRIKKAIIFEYLSLKYYISYNGGDVNYLNRYKITANYLASWGDKLIGGFFILGIIEILVIRYSPYLLTPIFGFLGIGYAITSLKVNHLSARITLFIIDKLFTILLPKLGVGCAYGATSK